MAEEQDRYVNEAWPHNMTKRGHSGNFRASCVKISNVKMDKVSGAKKNIGLFLKDIRPDSFALENSSVELLIY